MYATARYLNPHPMNSSISYKWRFKMLEYKVSIDPHFGSLIMSFAIRTHPNVISTISAKSL